ncbi:hypothetical protein FALBO_8699 [Fusarium albosuccineum]|uniref:Uncharacterized protein n=1 Tax=Fusarium albosuccineum TaxID=1237068 RepID=A0A8H4L978_9HYPO|nr:hypothetical protein FALBO_8699 [Fusarium albosuccineum]
MLFNTGHALAATLAVAAQVSSTWAAPATKDSSSVLSIRASDISNNNLTAYENHPAFALYTRWLDNDRHGSVPMKIRDAAAVKRDLEARWGFLWDVNKLVSNLHYKTYHTIEGEERPPAGYEHYVDWDFHCETVLYSSTGMSLANHHMEKGHISPGVNGYAYLDATLVQDPAKPLQNVRVAATFNCWLFSNKCCTDSMWTLLFIDGEEAVFPAPSTAECNGGKQVDGECS